MESNCTVGQREALILNSLSNEGWLRFVQWYDCVDSTNAVARTFSIDNSDKLPALFVADRQTNGRGRGNNRWWSPQGCLMMTLAIPSQLLSSNRSEWNQLALIVGVALGEAVERCLPNLKSQLKWPNDLYLDGRKAGGILIESLSPSKESTAFLIGIGVNINVDWSLAPADIQQRATCLSTVGKAEVTPLEFLPHLVDILFGRLENWRKGCNVWCEFWESRCFLTGRIVSIRLKSGTESGVEMTTGICQGIDSEGQLLVLTEQGNTTRIFAGEVQILS